MLMQMSAIDSAVCLLASPELKENSASAELSFESLLLYSISFYLINQ